MPSSQFFHLPEDKQRQILDASLKEFAENGYDLSSTNRIVQQAGISKGALFKYFTDKEALFLYVFDVYTKSYLDSLPREPVANVFEWARHAVVHKLQFLHKEPVAYQLWIRVAKNPRHPVYEKAVQSQFALLKQFQANFQLMIPADQLRPGFSAQHVMNYVTWVSTGLQEKYAAVLPDAVGDEFDEIYQTLVDEFNVYLDILKSGAFRHI